MKDFSYDTWRLNCRPLTIRDSVKLCEIVDDVSVKRFFSIGSSIEEVSEYIQNLISGEELFVGLYLKSTGQLIGIISGYRRTSSELLVEFLIDSRYREQKYMFEALSEFLVQARRLGYLTFLFWIEPDNDPSFCLVSHFNVRHFSDEDFSDNGRSFEVYRICY